MDATLRIPPREQNGRFLPSSQTSRRTGTKTEDGGGKLKVDLSPVWVAIIGVMQLVIVYATVQFMESSSRQVSRDEVQRSMPAIRNAAAEIADKRVRDALDATRRENDIRHKALLDAIERMRRNK